MSTLLTDLSPAKLRAANDANLAAWIPQLSRLGQSFDNNPPGVKRSITDPQFSLFNSVMDTHLEPGEVDAAVQTVLADARLHNVTVLWWIGSTTQPADLASRLEGFGFTVDEDGIGMAVDLHCLNEKIPPVPGLTIQRASDELSHHQWSRTTAKGFEVPESKHDFVEEQWSRFLGVADPDLVLAYTGFLGGTPVATSLLLLGGGVAGIYAVATVPEVRRKGIGARITLHPLLHARSLGYRVGILQSSPMGGSVYRSLGFKEICRVCSYRWSPEGSK